MNTSFGEFYSFDAKLSKGLTTGKRGMQLPRNSPSRPSFVLSHNAAPHHPTNGREGVFCDDTKAATKEITSQGAGGCSTVNL